MQSQNSQNLYTSAILLGPICAILGLDWDDVLAAAGLRYTDARSGGLLVSGDDYVSIWNAIVVLSGAEQLATDLGLRMAQGPAIPVLFAISSAPDFETGVTRMARYKHLFGPMRFAINRTKADCVIEVVPDGILTNLPVSFSSAQIIFLHGKAEALATRTFTPSFVSLPLPATERENLTDLFGREPAFGQPTLCYAASDMRIPFVSQNDELWAATEEDLQTQNLIICGESAMTHRVRASLLEAFATTEPTIAHVAARLNTSKSTLQRRLRDEDTTFQELLDATRSELALRYLRSSALSNQQIAHLLGYRDTSAFQRAFRKWTGKTPQELRRGGREPPPGRITVT
ncbi:MAG: helix-turn-helix domain-containing protein [Pseudomonadota bacterium]